MADRQHFLAGLGAALLNLSDGTRANRAENQAKLRDKQRQDMELARMALSREQFELDQKGFEAGQQRDARVFAKDVLETAGPNGVLDDTGSAAVEAGGFGFRLAPKQEGTLSSKPFVMDTINATPDVSMLRPEAYATGVEATPVSEGFNPGVMQTQSPGIGPGRQVIPTSDQSFQLEQQGKARNLEETRRRAQAAVSQPGFYKMPELNRAVVWQQAGFDGNPPMSLDEWKTREDYQLRNQLTAIGAQGQNQINAANVRADAAEQLAQLRLDGIGKNKPATGLQNKALGFYNRMKDATTTLNDLDDKVTQEDLEIIQTSPAPEFINTRLLSEAGQRYAQALRTFAEADLRRESGAAISQSEYAMIKRIYGKQAADFASTLTDKRRSRGTQLEAIAAESGRAYEDFYGEPFKRGQHVPLTLEDGTAPPAQPGGPRERYVRDPNTGQLVKVP